jgi:hypothetical protein
MASSRGRPHPPAPRRADLLGAWAFHRWRITYEDGSVTEPFGEGAVGLLLYTPDGAMSATIMAGGRAPLSAGNPRSASMGERAAAFDGYFSYAGRWRLSHGVVEHVVTVSLNPGLVGTRQWRHADLRGRRLTLSVEEPSPRGLRRHALEWRRRRRGA